MAKFEEHLMKNKDEEICQIICVIDGSGSMQDMMNEAVGALNNFIDDQRKIKGLAELTLIAFDDQRKIIHSRRDLQEIPKVKYNEVFLGGMTALYDAIGMALNGYKKTEKTICLIQTDGYENSSKEYTASDIQKLIKEREKWGWKFVFIGAGIDAFEEGAKFGLGRGQTYSVDRGSKGMAAYANTMSVETRSYRGADLDSTADDE